nr:Dihydrofolate reductase [uncultured bacterium]
MNISTHPILSAIVAMAENRIIGKNNQLPWHLPADLKHFKTITSGHPILMGRKTHESIGKPLPNRLNIILTRDPNYQTTGCTVVTSVESALKEAARHDENELFIIGGAEIYKQLLARIQRLYLTIVHHEVEGDAWFPELNLQEWKEISRVRHEADEANAFAYSFVLLERT